MRDVTLAEADLELKAVRAREDAEAMLSMSEDAFRLFYDRTARPVWLYLMKMTGDSHAADDLLQETYYRLLRANRVFESDEHRRNYLYRIATNLARDGRRRPDATLSSPLGEVEDAGGRPDENERAVGRADLARAMRRLSPRERALLWLAYAQGLSHEEIAESVGVKKASVKPLLFRARRRLAALLGRFQRES